MPIYDFLCSAGCGKFEDLVPWTQDSQPCPVCSQPAKKQVSAPLRTATLWGDTSFGINGHFDQGLQCRVTSYADTDRKLAARGLVRESDLGGDMYVERKMDAALLERTQHKAMVAEYTTNLKKFDGCENAKGLALAETFPAHKMLAESDTTP